MYKYKQMWYTYKQIIKILLKDTHRRICSDFQNNCVTNLAYMSLPSETAI